MEYQKMTDEEFKGIYTSKKFRNEVAFAHKCCASGGQFKFYGTCTYPNSNRRQVTLEQIEEAKRVREVAKWKTLKENHNKLLFVGMGMNYEPRFEDDVCNHRIRTEFITDEGKTVFVEFSNGHCNYSVDRDLQKVYESKAAYYSKLAAEARKNKEWAKETMLRNQVNRWLEQPYYNYKGLQGSVSMPKYTKQNILKLVNDTFGCSFKEIVIDYYNVSCEGILCVSPGFEVEPVKA